MKSGPTLVKSEDRPVVASFPPPTLIVQLAPRWRVFAGNLLEFFRPAGRPTLSSSPGVFWPDVFVSSRLPWFRFLQSVTCHCLVVTAIWGFSRIWPVPTHIAPPVLTSADVIAPSGSLYLPPLDTRRSVPQVRVKGEPVLAPQPILSVPPEADNRSQTIVTPPDIRLKQNVPLPNIVAWSHTSVPVPLAATARDAAEMKIPALPSAIIAPPPEMNSDVSRRSASLTQQVIAPPPTIDTASARRIGDINIGHADVVAPAPQLPMSEQRTLASGQPALGGSVAVPPPPSTQGVGSSGGGRLIALGIHPEPTAPPVAPQGNRRGSFEAGPNGKAGGSGTPNVAGDPAGAGSGGSGKGSSDVPSGLFVGKAPGSAVSAAAAGSRNSLGNGAGNGGGETTSPLIASVIPPRASAIPQKAAAPVLEEKATELDKQVFGSRQFYSMALNMPNLNSAGGSWVIRFAELKDASSSGELLAPVVTQKVDPAYPLELMRRNVEGTVALYAVIHSDGRVSDVRVLRGVDDRLDGYAISALSRWHFQPATKNGAPVALEAVVMIPFKTGRKF